jgi:hypothetical protein
MNVEGQEKGENPIAEKRVESSDKEELDELRCPPMVGQFSGWLKVHSGPTGRGHYNFFCNPNAINFGILEAKAVELVGTCQAITVFHRAPQPLDEDVKNLRLRDLKRLPGASEEPSFLDFFSEPMVNFPQHG